MTDDRDDRRILIVGDGANVNEVRAMADAGYSVETAESVEEAARMIASENFGRVIASSSQLPALALSAISAALAAATGELQSRGEQTSTEQKLALLEAVTQQTHTGLAYLDMDFRFLWVNSAYIRESGYAREQLLGRNYFDLLPDPKRQVIFETVRETGVPHQARQEPFVFPARMETGGSYWNWSLVPVKRTDGTILGFVLSMVDLTEDVRICRGMQELQEQANRQAAELDAFVSSTVDGMALVGADGKTVFVNEAGMRFLGIPVGESLVDWERRVQRYTLDGMPLPSADFPANRALRGETVHQRYKVITTTGDEVIFSTNASPVKDLEGRVVGAAVVFRDISERVQLERDRQELYERERHIADVLQNALIPPFTTHRIPGISLALHYQALLNEAEVGGDFYDVFQLDESNYGILIGDVIGKGLSAAIHVAAVRHSIRSYAYVNPSPAKAMTLANDALCREQSDESGVITAFLAVIDTQRRTMTYANGGHEPPSIKSADGGVTELGQSGLVLGVERGFSYIESTLLLEPGDTVVMTTDGITEARRSARELFGKEGIIAYLARTKHGSPEDIAAGLMDAARAHAGGNLQDDAAVLVLVVDNE